MPSWLQKAVQWAVGKSMGVPAFWFARGIEMSTADNLYEPFRSSVWVQAAIGKVAGPVASVQPCFYKSAATGVGMKRWRKKSGSSDEIDLPVMRAFLKSPMAGMGYADFIEATVGWLKLKGESFWILDDSALVPFPEVRTKVPQVIVARPDRMRHIVENGELKGWEYRDAKGMPHTLLPEQVIQNKRWNPYDQWRGLGEYESAQIATEGDWMAGKFIRNLMANNGDTGPYLIAKNGIPTNEQREQILADLRSKREATMRGQFKAVFLTGDITVEDPQVKSADAALISTRTESRHEIFIAFGVPPSMADVKAAYSIGSASDFYQLITTTCVPTGEKVADGLERLTKMLTGVDVEIALNWDEHPVFQEVRSERLKSADSLFSKGMPMKEISDYLGLELPRFKGDDVGRLPINLVTVDEANKPAPDPTSDPAYSESRDPNKPAEPGTAASQIDEAEKRIRKALANRKAERAESQKAIANKRLWNLHMQRRMPAVRLFESKFSRVLNDYRAIALQRLSVAKKQIEDARTKGATLSEIKINLADGESAGTSGSQVVTKSLLDLIFDKERFGASLVAQFQPVQRTVLDNAASELMEEIGRADDPWKMPPQAALKFINQRDVKIRGVGETVRSQINTALSNAYEDGATTDQLADAVRGVFNNLSKNEALRIANTETSAAYGFSRHEAMTAAGITRKMWISSHGPHVRPAHAAAEFKYTADPIPIDEPFIVDDEELMYPGDESGSAENVINCQCIQIAAAGEGDEE